MRTLAPQARPLTTEQRLNLREAGRWAVVSMVVLVLLVGTWRGWREPSREEQRALAAATLAARAAAAQQNLPKGSVFDKAPPPTTTAALSTRP